MTNLTGYKTYHSYLFSHDTSYNAACLLQREAENRLRNKIQSELFASLDDDTELMFGDGVEDY